MAIAELDETPPKRRGRPPKAAAEAAPELPETQDVLFAVPVRIGSQRPKYVGDLIVKGWQVRLHVEWSTRTVWIHSVSPTGVKALNWTPFENIVDGACLVEQEEKADD